MTRSREPNHWIFVALAKVGLLLAIPGIAPSCGDSGHVLGRVVPPDGSVRVGDAGDGGPVACAGLGPSILLPTSSGSTCAAALATRLHRFAVCVCDALSVTAPVYADFLDSSGGSSGTDSGQPSAAIGVNGNLQTSSRIQAFGSVYVAGAGGLTTSDSLVALGSLHVAGPMNVLSNGDIDIAGDAYADGEIDGLVLVGGTLHLDSGAVVTKADITAGAVVREPVHVDPPCDCGAQTVDVAGAIAAATAHNDDVTAGFTPDRLVAVTTSTLLDVPCGTYALSSIDAQQSLVLAVHGRSLMAVAGDVALRAGFTVSLDPGAELDLLIGGRLLASGGNPIGSLTPARFRIWVAGSKSVVFDDDPKVGAVIHAAGAPVTASSGMALSGSLFTKTLTAGARVDLHFDEDLFSVGVTCGEPIATAVP